MWIEVPNGSEGVVLQSGNPDSAAISQSANTSDTQHISTIRVVPSPFWNNDKTVFDLVAYLRALGTEETEYTLTIDPSGRNRNSIYNDCLITVWISTESTVYVQCLYNFTNYAFGPPNEFKGWWQYTIEMWSDESYPTSNNTVTFADGKDSKATRKQVELMIEALNRIINNTDVKTSPFDGFSRYWVTGFDDGGVNAIIKEYDENLLPWSER